MSTIEDFKNAPTGATATHKATGNRVMKVDGVELRWITRWGRRLTDKEVVRWGFTLDRPAPTTAREALDLAWELAHPVKEGQIDPKGTRYLELRGYKLDPLGLCPTSAREALDLAWNLAHPVKEGQVIPEGSRYLTSSRSGVKEHTTQHDVKIRSSHATVIRTFDPLPDPEPEWLDAPAVLARLEAGEAATEPEVWIPAGDGMYARAYHNEHTHWSDLCRVTPLYPKEGQTHE